MGKRVVTRARAVPEFCILYDVVRRQVIGGDPDVLGNSGRPLLILARTSPSIPHGVLNASVKMVA